MEEYNENSENLESNSMAESKNVAVSVKANVKDNLNLYLQATAIEYFGVLLDERLTKTTETLIFLFDNAKFGKEFHDLLIKSQVKATLEDC